MKNHISMILIVVMAISYLAIGGRPDLAHGQPVNGCDQYSGKAKKLCAAYCEKLDCDSEIPWWQKLRSKTCKFIS
jgi:hypothetical protein